MDDEDEFVDAVEGREEEGTDSTDEKSGNEGVDDDGGFGDDDFGDFAEEEDEDEDDEVHEEYDPEVEESTRNLQEIHTSEVTAELVSAETSRTPIVCPDRTF
jgi:hypothetical protein